EAMFMRTAVIRLTSRVVPRREVQGFRECRSNYTENDVHLWGIEMLTLGKPVRFAFRLPDGERAWLIYQLNRFLQASGPVEGGHVRQATSLLSGEIKAAEKAPPIGPRATTEILAFDRTLA